MNQLIPTRQNDDGSLLVTGRDLHEFLEINSNYTTWIKRMLEYGFLEGLDFIPKMEESNGGRPSQDHHIKIDMAKEISMLQRNEKGKKARLYFLELERKWNSPEMILKRSRDILDAKVAQLETTNLALEQKVQEYEPKATYYDLVMQNKSLLAISVIAKDYGLSGTALNKMLHELGVQYKQSETWLLYQKYANEGYTHSKTQDYDGGAKSKLHTYWTQRGRLFIYETLKSKKGIVPFLERENEQLRLVK